MDGESGSGEGSMWTGRGVSLYSMHDIFDPGRTGTAMLSMNPERFRCAPAQFVTQCVTNWKSQIEQPHILEVRICFLMPPSGE